MAENKKMTGYPSIDKPWLKYYDEDKLSFSVPNCTQGELPLAFIVPKGESSTSSDALIEAVKAICTKALPEYSQPADIRICSSLPLTDVGKIDYRALEKLAEEEI